MRKECGHIHVPGAGRSVLRTRCLSYVDPIKRIATHQPVQCSVQVNTCGLITNIPEGGVAIQLPMAHSGVVSSCP
jgi:hypothetical protein